MMMMAKYYVENHDLLNELLCILFAMFIRKYLKCGMIKQCYLILLARIKFQFNSIILLINLNI